MQNRLNGLKTWRSLLALAGLLLIIAVIGSQPTQGKPLDKGSNPGVGSQQPVKPSGAAIGPIVGRAERFDVSPPLSAMAPGRPQPVPDRRGEANENPMLPGYNTGRWVQDSVVQKVFGPFAMPTPVQNWDGMYNYWGPIPPDTNGEVGPYHYFQIVNSGFQISTKSGTSLYGPANTNTLWRGFGGPCETRNDGDPVILYDQIANRWNASQFTSASPYYQCIALSTSGDPLGTWYRYAFLESATVFGDYPHLGVWPDGYYMTINQFEGGSGGGNYAFERPKMLVGDPNARFVYFQTPNGGALPTDLEGMTPPPTGRPNFFLFPTDSGNGTLAEYKFHVDWTQPLSSTFTGPTNIDVAAWNPIICDAGRGQCIQQPNTSAQLEAIADRLMFRLTYRNFGDHESLLANHTVNVTSTVPGLAGIRWYEIRQPMTPTLFQQGTYTQPDNTHRWMGSIAMDRVGNIALGFSASSSVISPSVRYAGRLVTDPPGQMAQGEATFKQGMGVEDFPGTARWGDYSDMTVDPTDDCTFWYTTEYFERKGNRNWRTRVGAFKFPNCGPAPTPTPCAMNFSDVLPGHTFYEYVRCLYCRGAISGYADGTFRPFNNTTRGQLTKIVVLGFAMPINTAGGPHFTDVHPGDTFYTYIETAYNAGLISGYADGTFRPGNDVTRGQLCKIVVQAAGNNVQGWVVIDPATPTFSDVHPGDTFYTYIETAYCHGIISGYADGTFKPGNNATRGQISKIVCLAVRNETACNTLPSTNTPTPAPTLCPGGFTQTGALTGSDPVQGGRLTASSPSICAIGRGCPGVYTLEALPRHYDVYTYTNTLSTAQCITVRITEACGDNHLRSTAYLGSFNPSNLCLNYLADHGGVGGQTFSYSFNVPPSSSALIVVYEGVSNLSCPSYTVNVSPCAGVPTYTPTITRTPTLTPTCVPIIYSMATGTATMIPGGTRVDDPGCDDCLTRITLPFPFTFYNQVYTSTNALVGSNGTVQFTSGDGQPNIYSPPCLPVAGANPPFPATIFAYYDDLRTDQSTDSGIFTQTIGSAPNRQFVMRWHTTYFSGSGTADFEVILTEGSPNFTVIYGANAQNFAAAGVLRSTSLFTQYSCQTPLASGLRLDYIAGANVCATPTSTPTAGAVTNTPTPGVVTNTPTPGGCAGGGWTTASPIPTLRARALGVTFNNHIYVFGGRPDNTIYAQTVYDYNIAGNSWQLMSATLPDANTSNMSGGVLTFPEGQRIFIAGGSGTASFLTGRTTAFDPATGTFTAKADWPVTPIHLPGGWAVANNKFYVFGGFIPAPAPGTVTNDIWVYDPTTNAWTQLAATLTQARAYIAAEYMPNDSGGRIYLAGGSLPGTNLTDEMTFEKFNPANNTIAAGTSLPEGTSNAQGYNVNNQFYLPGGHFATPSTHTLVYDAGTNAWTQGPELTQATRNYAKGYGAGGSIHVIGGVVGTTFYDLNQKFTSGGACTNTPTPSGGTPTPTLTPASCASSGWTSASPIPTARGRAAGATMGNHVYAMGGRPDGTTYAQTVYDYNTTTGAWLLMSATLPDAMTSNMAAGVLTFPEGPRVFIVGGSGTGSVLTGRTLAFDPAAGTFTPKATWPASPVRLPGGWAVANNKFYVFGGFVPTPAPGTVYAEIWVYDPTTNAWTQASANLTQARAYIATETMPSGLIYLAGGSAIDTVGGTLTDEMTFDVFNPATGTISAGPALPEPKSNNSGYVYGGEFYVPAGGFVAANHNTHVLIYNGSAWRQGSAVVNTTRNYTKGYGTDGTLYMFGGLDPTAAIWYDYNQKLAPGGVCTNTPTPAGNTFTPTRTPTSGGNTPTPTRTNTPGVCNPTWIPGPTITPARHLFQGAVGTNGNFYIVGGQISASTATAVPNVEMFNTTTNTWTQRAPLQVGVGQVSVGGANGKIYAAGGFIGGNVVTSTLQVYDIASNTWSFGPSLPGIEEAGAGVVLGNFFYVIGGDDFNAGLTSVYRFDLTTNTWSTRAPLPAARTNTSATAYGGFVYVFGGVIGAMFTADDHLLRYDPVANTWTDLGSAGTAGHGNYGTITPFAVGKLLVTDGGTTAFVPVATTHIYDIASNTWTPGPTLATARLGQAWGQLPDGRIIEAGGLGAGTPQPILASTEILPSCGPGLQGVQITNFTFSPQTLTVPAGTTVRWTNFDADTHTSTSSAMPPVWDSGPLAQFAFYQRTFSTPGTFNYICSVHPSMTGTIMVTGP